MLSSGPLKALISRGDGMTVSASRRSYDVYEQCLVSPDCFTCPRPQCVHDDPPRDPNAVSVSLRRQRDAEILRLMEAAPGSKKQRVILVAQSMHLTPRSVYRTLQREG